VQDSIRQIDLRASASLERLGIRYQAFEERHRIPASRIESAGAQLTLIVSLGEPVSVGRVGSVPKPCPAFVVGIGSDPCISEHAGALRCVEVAVPALLAEQVAPGAAASTEPVALQDCWPVPVRDHLLRASEATDWQLAVHSIDAALGILLASAEPRHAGEAARCWHLLEMSGGQAAVRDVAHSIGCSERHLIASFRASAGVTPKTAARRLRYEQARRRLDSGPASLADIAAACGYSDQSHMTREFVRFGGQTPAAYRKLGAVGSA